ncbi:acyl-CoA dehydrogenase family protein [Bradyrhizobium sp. 1]|nr:acyl-CoA dehydrogenase family protein [Bradyrhizobium sp. 1]
MSLSDELAMLAESVEKTVERVSPLQKVQKLDAEKTFDRELHQALAEIGVLGVGVPEEMEGSGGSAEAQALVLEILGRMATSSAVYMVVHFLVTGLLRDYATDAQRKQYLEPLMKGESFGSFCLTEAGGGTDILTAMKTKARRDGNDWILSGSKMWISGATFCNFMVVLARTGENRARGITMFLLPRETPGIEASRLATFAINGYPTCEVHFDNVRVPASAVLGQIDMGFMQVLTALNNERLNAAAAVTGIGRGALETAVTYAKERQAFGRPIGQFQALQHRLSAVGIALEAAWSLTLEAARRHAAGGSAEVLSSMAKYAASKAAVSAADIGMEAMASAGFDQASPMQRYYRDCRLHVFAPLNNDMVLNFVSERWLGLPRSY